MIYRGKSHQETFERELRARPEPCKRMVSGLYLLTADADLWEQVKDGVSIRNIFVEDMRPKHLSAPGYLAYLREFDISYIFAGNELIDCAVLLHKLKTLFGIDRLMIAGGGVTNWPFAQAGLLDELSVIVAPVADGNTRSVSIFERTAVWHGHYAARP